jgi:hypothetical protein
MITKTLIAAAAVSAIALGASAPANAKVHVDLYVGGFAPGYYEPVQPSYPVYDNGYGDNGYDDNGYQDDGYRRHHRRQTEYYGISCDDGSQAVRDIGFRKVRAIDCSGRRYTYQARRHGSTFIVKVSSRNGQVLSVQESY